MGAWSPWGVPVFFEAWDRGRPGGFETSENGPLRDPDIRSRGRHSTRLVTVNQRWDDKWSVGVGTRSSDDRQWNDAGAYGPFDSKSEAKEFAEKYRGRDAFFSRGLRGPWTARALSPEDQDRERRENDRIEHEAAMRGRDERLKRE